MRVFTAPALTTPNRHLVAAVTLLLLLISVFSVAGAVLVPSSANATPPGAFAQCNGNAPGVAGATTGMHCDVTIVNTIDRGNRSSTITVTRQCSLDPCAPGNGTFTTTSNDLTTNINQCNGSNNLSANPITCNVTITNNISLDTPDAQSLAAATVNQCVGSGAGGGGTVNCDPFPATTTNATITQCNGSANGGGGTAACTVDTNSQVSGAVPITINQCNGTGNSGGSVLTCGADISTNITKITSTLTLDSSASSTTFGTSVTLTATAGPGTPTGVVTFYDVASSGGHAGQSVSLGTVSSTGVASLTVALPAFGTNSVTAVYGGDGTYAAATSNAVRVQVSAVAGSVIVNQFRLTGPGGADDAYLEIYNTGVPVPLAGFVVATGSGGVVTLPVDAPTLPPYRSYLVTGSAYSLAGVASPDEAVTSLGTGGLRLVAPDGNATVTDAVGSTGSGYFLGTALPALSDTQGNQYAWVRLEAAGRPTNTSNNASDFKLVSTIGGVVGGVSGTLGTPSPRSFGSPFQHNATLYSTLLDTGVSSSAVPNRVSSAGTPGTLVVRRTITNTSSTTVAIGRIRITSISELNGALLPGATAPVTQAMLRIVNPGVATSSITLSGNRIVTVHNLSVDTPASTTPGGGLASTMTLPVPDGGLAAGASINVAFTFAVDHGGTFWFGYDVDAL